MLYYFQISSGIFLYKCVLSVGPIIIDIKLGAIYVIPISGGVVIGIRVYPIS